MSKLTVDQQEQLSSLGLYLQSIRQEQGRAVDEVATQIFIRPALLQALEAGNGEDLPEPVFIQGFIRRYADALGLDGREISLQFVPTAVSVLPDPEAAQGGMDGVVSRQEQHRLKVLAPAEPSTRSSRSGSGIGLWITGVVALAIAAGGLWAVLGAGGDRPNLNLAERDTPEGTATTPAAATPEPETEPTAAAPPLEPTAPVTVAVNLTGDSWLQVTADGEEVYEGILRSGSQETWTAESELVIATGNAGAVQLSYNGAEQQPMGDLGTVERRTFTPQGGDTAAGDAP